MSPVPYPCRYCSKSFPDPAKLRSHYGMKAECRAKREREMKDLSEVVKQTHRRTVYRNARRPAEQRRVVIDASRSASVHRDKDAIEPMEIDGELGIEEEAEHENNEPEVLPAPPPVRSPSVVSDVEGHPDEAAIPRPQRHGYATIELHDGAARVIRWENLDDNDNVEPAGAEDVLRQKEWFELAEWLATLPISNGERARYFEIERHKRGLPWQNLNEFYRSIDRLDHGPDWSSKPITIKTSDGEETVVVYKRNPVEVVRHLIGLQRLDKHMKYGPEKHWTLTVDGRRIRVYSETWTGNWWWRMQDLLTEGATIAPIILATDRTQLSLLGGDKAAWPVYQSIGNISKSIRRRPSQSATLLVGYIPETKLLWIRDPDERRRKQWELFHASMSIILEPLKNASIIGVEMRCADGGVRRVYPIFAAHIGDWPEQCTIACTQTSRCPVCIVPFRARGSGNTNRLRTKHQTLELLRDGQRGCVGRRESAGLRGTWPFWADIPWANGQAAIVPDLLHQMHKGVVKSHIMKWWTRILGTNELDQRFSAMPRYAGLRHFRIGVTSFTQWTGTESKAAARVSSGENVAFVEAERAPELSEANR